MSPGHHVTVPATPSLPRPCKSAFVHPNPFGEFSLEILSNSPILTTLSLSQVGPVGLLYVDQREMAAVAPHDKNVNIIGSDDATSCIIVVVRQSGSGAVALAHLDGTGTDEACTTMISRVQELSMGYPEGRIELQLIGGFRDQKGYAEDLFSNIMRKCGHPGLFVTDTGWECG